MPSVSIVGGGVANFSLLNGDIDGDNELTLFDFGVLVSNLGAIGHD